jgi:excisionase family DNA binding protein
LYLKGTIVRATPEEVEEILSFPTCTVEQAASVLGVGRGHAYRAVKAGEIPAIHIGTRMLVKTATLRRMISNGADAA